MKLKIQIFILFILTGHILLLLLSSFSLVGFWTDVVVPLTLLIGLAFLLFRKQSVINKMRNILRISTLGISILYVFIGIRQFNYLGAFNFFDSFKLTSFYWEDVSNRTFNAYFQPVGAYSGGEGNFWITESPSYFPFIEETVYYKHAILWDFGVEEWDGQTIDQTEEVRSHIMLEVIKNKK